MLSDTTFGCVTTRGVRDEFVKGPPRFRAKYPWRKDMRPFLKHLPSSEAESADVKIQLEAIEACLRLDPQYNLSRVDKGILACALEYGYVIVTEERVMAEFGRRTFPTTYKGDWSALELLNSWIESDLVEWSQALEEILCDWRATGEKPQPASAIERYEKLTGHKYVGS